MAAAVPPATETWSRPMSGRKALPDDADHSSFRIAYMLFLSDLGGMPVVRGRPESVALLDAIDLCLWRSALDGLRHVGY